MDPVDLPLEPEEMALLFTGLRHFRAHMDNREAQGLAWEGMDKDLAATKALYLKISGRELA